MVIMVATLEEARIYEDAMFVADSMMAVGEGDAEEGIEDEEVSEEEEGPAAAGGAEGVTHEELASWE